MANILDDEIQFANIPDDDIAKPEPRWSDLPRNIIPSFGKFAKSVISPFTHPVETARGLGKLAGGTAQMLIPGEQGDLEEYPRAVGQYYKERYGGGEEAKRSLIEDPVGVAADASTVLTGGGGIAAKVPGIIGKAGTVASKAGGLLNPVSVAALPLKGAKVAAQAVGLPEALMGGVMKLPTGTWKGAKRNQIIHTALKEKITMREGGQGMEKVKGLIDTLDNEVNDAINAASRGGAEVDLLDIMQAVENVKSNPRYANSLFKNRYVKEVDDFVDDAFMNNLAIRFPNGKIPLSEAQAIKKATYQDLDSFFRKMNKPSDVGGGMKGVMKDTDAVAAHIVTREIRDQILRELPAKALPLKREGELVTLKTAMERSLARTGNWDIATFYDFLIAEVATGGGLGVGAIPAAAAVRILRSPAVVSKMAIWLANKSKTLEYGGKAALATRSVDEVYNPERYKSYNLLQQ
jgi:hypothetical protein